jgi:hypothetical protein
VCVGGGATRHKAVGVRARVCALKQRRGKPARRAARRRAATALERARSFLSPETAYSSSGTFLFFSSFLKL